MTFRPLPSLSQCSERLELIFPRAAFDTVLSNPLSAAAIAAMIYVDAVVDDEEPAEDATWARPTTCLWLSPDVYAKSDDASRSDWREAALGGNAKRKVTDLQKSWGLPFFEQPYADNTREGLRDETLPGWVELGAARKRAGLATSSPLGRWALTASFADLFDPGLSGDKLTAAVEAWRKAHMGPGARMKALVAQQRRDANHAITVTLPGGGDRSRTLEPGMASVILKGVIELWAPARLTDPIVLTISEPGDKIYKADGDILQALGVAIDVGRLLPDALIVDIGTDPSTFWVVEAVATDGPITEARKQRLLNWAEEQRIPPDDCRFLTAFTSRNDAPAKKRLKDLASGTFAWYLDEPSRELAWHEIDSSSDA